MADDAIENFIPSDVIKHLKTLVNIGEYKELRKMLQNIKAEMDIQNQHATKYYLNVGELLPTACMGLVGPSDMKLCFEAVLAYTTDLNVRRLQDGYTALHLAAKSGKTDLMKMLLIKGAEVDSRDDNDNTPLHVALDEKRYEAAKLLLTYNANVNAKNRMGRTPLRFAVNPFSILYRRTASIFERVAGVMTLIEKGADINAACDSEGRTALNYASNIAHETVGYLLSFTLLLKGAVRADVYTWDMNGNNTETIFHALQAKFDKFIEYCKSTVSQNSKSPEKAGSKVLTLQFFCKHAVQKHNIEMENLHEEHFRPTTIEESVLLHMRDQNTSKLNLHNVMEIFKYFNNWEPKPEASSSESATPRVDR